MQRGVADAIEGHVADHIRAVIESIDGLDTGAPRSRRSIEDFSVKGDTGTAWVDIKSKDLDGTFSMPNLISIQRLWKVMQAPAEEMIFIFVDYTIIDKDKGRARIDSILCIPAEKMNADLLQIQNLGLGQLQMRADADSKGLLIPSAGRSLKERLPEMAKEFHQRQVLKAQREMDIWAARA